MEVVLSEKFLLANGIERTISLVKIDTGYVTIIENKKHNRVVEPSFHFERYLDDANVYYIFAKNDALGMAETTEDSIE